MAAAVARVFLDVRLLDALLVRMRSSPELTDVVEQRFSDPALGIVAAQLKLGIRSTRVALRRSDGGRARVEVEMRGVVVWDAGVATVPQHLDVRFAVLVRPWAELLDDGKGLRLGVDLDEAKVRDVDVTVHQVSAIPVGRASDLIGPVGRRVLDRLSAEAIKILLRRTGRREIVLDTPIGVWLRLLGTRPGPVAVDVDDRGASLTFVSDGPRTSGGTWAVPITPARGDAPGLVFVDVDPSRAAPLVEHWLANLASDQEVYRVRSFRVLADATARVELALTRGLPRSLPAVAATLTVQVAPVLHQAELFFELLSVTIQDKWAGGAAGDGAAWLVRRRLESRLRIPGRWELPLPFGDQQSWLIGLRDIDLDPDRVRIVLDAWLPPA